MARFFKNSFSDYLITPEDSRITPEGLVIDLRLPWYRSLPLSVVMPTQLLVDGDPVSLEGATVEYEGKRYTLAELPEQTGTSWFIQDSVLLHVPTPRPLAAGKHHVVVTLNLYPPYIPMLTHVTRGDAQVLAA
ncbi:C-glycoside deglycosidase beta subunit domain-containing protein [Ramlibacter sp. MAHUQ-53]|uniref:C-glycoside deglycosidase beta subunit domain-containing protein n=1 Tax=unclassified Ramlibacter TaxID=2617605 RepID=UPI003637C9EC